MLDFIKPKVTPFLIGVLLVNVVFLDYHILFRANTPIVQNINLSNPSSNMGTPENPNGQTVQVEPGQTVSENNTCLPSCLDAIKSATASLKLNQTIIITQAPAQASSQTATVQPSGQQEYFIPFGAASGASQGTFTSLPGLSVYVNTDNYSNISYVTFEVSAHIPNGNQTIYIQLYNSTDGTVISNSQLTMSGGTPQLLISPNITLPPGNKLYQVQINTQLNDVIKIDQARLHIITN